MKVLAIDSSGLTASVAIVDDTHTVAEYTVNYDQTAFRNSGKTGEADGVLGDPAKVQAAKSACGHGGDRKSVV